MQEGLRKTSRIGYREPTLDWGLVRVAKISPISGSDSLPDSTVTTGKPRKTVRFCSYGNGGIKSL